MDQNGFVLVKPFNYVLKMDALVKTTLKHQLLCCNLTGYMWQWGKRRPAGAAYKLKQQFTKNSAMYNKKNRLNTNRYSSHSKEKLRKRAVAVNQEPTRFVKTFSEILERVSFGYNKTAKR